VDLRLKNGKQLLRVLVRTNRKQHEQKIR